MHGSHISCHNNTNFTCLEVVCYDIDLGNWHFDLGKAPPIRVQYLDGSGPMRVLHSVTRSFSPISTGGETTESSVTRACPAPALSAPPSTPPPGGRARPTATCRPGSTNSQAVGPGTVSIPG